MNGNEAHSRIKINKLLDEAGWRFFDDEKGPANICLEQNVKITKTYLDELGNDFEKTKDGFTDYSLLGQSGNVVAVLEAKASHINPLVGKEQARAYAYKQRARFVILSNGDTHYLWDTWMGDPRPITSFPRLEEIEDYKEFEPSAKNITEQIVGKDYIAVTQLPGYANDPRWQDEARRSEFIDETKLKFLRPFQLRAIHRIQEEVAKGKDRFLFEMATGTGKTLTSAAVIKLFLRSGNVTRVLFLVDRLELEDQAWKNFVAYLKADYTCKIYKENRDDWRSAEIVVSTVQSFLHNNKYRRIFKPNDFQLIISDEAHRSIGGNSRAVFEYFIGYKLGLTATPRNYLKKVDAAKVNARDPREMERRLMLDTYNTFGCESGEPTFSYSLTDGVRDGYLINPIVSDARTEITTQLLSDKGYSVAAATSEELNEDEEAADETDAANEETFFSRDFERKFFSENTNRAFCKTFLENALTDPISGEIGKTIVFCVSQTHAAKIAQILNELANVRFPGKYSSDFAMQVTSQVADAQQMTINFTNNNLGGKGNFDMLYQTSKTRVCVTVGMMTTGYDCPDILNICLMRPIFSPTDFVQIKGRGTRKHNFTDDYRDIRLAAELGRKDKERFKLFDFFANCEYFEDKFNYDEVLKLPVERSTEEGGTNEPPPPTDEYINFDPDEIKTIDEIVIGVEGMKIDRRLFERFEDRVKSDAEIQRMVEKRDFQSIEDYIVGNLFDKPEDYYNLEKLRQTLKIDRRLGLREIVEKIFGFIPYFKTKEQLLEEEFDKFDSRYKPDEKDLQSIKYFFKVYLTDPSFREILESKQFPRFHNHANGRIFFEIPVDARQKVVEYIKDNVPLNQFME